MSRPPLNAHRRGLGRQHRNQRARLLARTPSGTPCPCTDCGPSCPCRAAGLPLGRGLPMHHNPDRNVDGMPLEADHGARARAHGGHHADRLLLATCNRSRGANGREQPDQPTAGHDVNSRRW